MTAARLLTFIKRIGMAARSFDEVKNMGLYVHKSSDGVFLILHTIIKPDPKTKYYGFEAQDFLIPTIRGYAHIRKSKQTWYLDFVAAEDKFGPLMYELAMSYAQSTPTKWLAQSKGSNTDAALAVWAKFLTRSDINHQHGMFQLKHPHDLSALKKNHDKMARAFAKCGVPINEFNENTVYAGDEFFSKKFKSK